MRFAAVFFLFIVSALPYSGFIVRTDPVSDTIDVRIYKTASSELSGFTAEQWEILDSKGKRIGIFLAETSRREQKSMLLSGTIQKQKSKHNIYAGLKVELRPVNPKELKVSRLPDTAVPAETALDARIVPGTDNRPMILIPAGKFIFGSGIRGSLDYTATAERQQSRLDSTNHKKMIHYMDLPAFYIDEFEVSNREFNEFLRQSAYQAPPHLSNLPDNDFPVENTDYNSAQAYCRYAGKRLTGELEWEKAARGPGLSGSITEEETFAYIEEPFEYPHGNEFSPEKCNTRETGAGRTMKVRETGDMSPMGVQGMCGNVPEWTDSFLLPYRGNTVPHELFGHRYKVIRGGSYRDGKERAKTYHRSAGGIPTLKDDFRAGIRCAKSR